MRSVLHASPLRAAVHLTKCTLHSAASVPPVTLLSGFLGTGKTTALTKILDSRAELNLAVIVNDVATVNVEAASMKAQPVSTGTKPVELIELSNGCGSKAGELASSIELLFELGARREAPFDHVIVEIPGVADPAAVRGYLEQAGIPVTRVLTFIDTPSITDQWMTMDFLEKCTEGEDPHTAQKRVVSLLTAQIEAADVIALNKIDLATDQQICNATRICTALTATQSEIREPTILTTRFGVAPLKDMLPQLALVSSCEDSKPNIDSTTCQTCQGLMTKDTTMDALGIHSFVLSSDRPFDDLRLFCLVHHWPMFRTAEKALEKRGGVLRSKGTICVRSDFHTMREWDFSGGHFSLLEKPGGVMSTDNVNGKDVPGQSEVVFIGLDLDEDSMRAELNECLLTDEELSQYVAQREHAKSEVAEKSCNYYKVPKSN